jgi:hypothetical protein
METLMNKIAFSDVALCKLVEVYQRFKGAYCLHIEENEFIDMVMALNIRRLSVIFILAAMVT